MNNALSKLSLEKVSDTILRLHVGEEERMIEVIEKNKETIDLILEIINACQHFPEDIIPCSEEEFFRSLGVLSGGKFNWMNDVIFGMESLSFVIQDIQFNSRESILLFLPNVLSRLNIPLTDNNQ